MPTLENPRYEAFAQARAKGALLMDAYESAGFVRHRGHPSRLAWKPEVAERIAELRALQKDMEDVTPQGLLASLRGIIKAAEGSDNAARLAILDASRLQAELARMRREEFLFIRKEIKAFGAVDFDDEPPPAKRPQTPQTAQATPQQAPAVAPPSPIHRPTVSPGAPRHLLASAALSPLARPGLAGLPGLPKAASPGGFGPNAFSVSAPGPGRSPPRHAPSAAPR